MSDWPFYDEEQIEEVAAVLRSGKVNAWTGPHVGDFEEAYRAYLGRRHAIALANGSVALDLAMIAIGLRPGDEVIVTPRSFVASASCVPLAGGVPVFADVDPQSQNLTRATIEPKLSERTRAIVIVHLAGWPCDMEPIVDLARARNIAVIEDCSQAHGALYRGKPVGHFGDIATFSFCQDKIVTTGGEGGLVAMDDGELWRRAWSFKDHGKSHAKVFSDDHPPGFRWLHDSFGTNYRMTSIQAVLGSHQLARLEDIRAVRARNAEILIEACRDLPALRTPLADARDRHAWYRFYTFVRPERLKPDWSRDRILAQINAAGIPCFSGSCSEIYLERAFLDRGFGPPAPLANARALGETSLALLVDPAKDAAFMRKAAETLRSVVGMASAQ